MLTSQLLVMAEYFGRLDPRRHSDRSADRPASMFRRLLAAVVRRLQRRSLPADLSDHLCRDIGIEPMPKRKEWPLLW